MFSQRDELVGGQRFGSCLSRLSDLLKDVLRGARVQIERRVLSQNRSELLPPPAEARAYGVAQRPLVIGLEWRWIEGSYADDGRVDSRPRPKDRPGHDEHALHRCHGLHAHGERPVAALSRGTNETIGHLFLDHQHQLTRPWAFEEVEDEGCGHVVRDVADYGACGGIARVAQWDLECVTFNHRQLTDRLRSPRPSLSQYSILLDHGQGHPQLEQPLGQRPPPRPDFDDVVNALEFKGPDDSSLGVGVDQEVLPKRAPGPRVGPGALIVHAQARSRMAVRSSDGMLPSDTSDSENRCSTMSAAGRSRRSTTSRTISASPFSRVSKAN